jgi:hypothetical protein
MSRVAVFNADGVAETATPKTTKNAESAQIAGRTADENVQQAR